MSLPNSRSSESPVSLTAPLMALRYSSKCSVLINKDGCSFFKSVFGVIEPSVSTLSSNLSRSVAWQRLLRLLRSTICSSQGAAPHHSSPPKIAGQAPSQPARHDSDAGKPASEQPSPPHQFLLGGCTGQYPRRGGPTVTVDNDVNWPRGQTRRRQTQHPRRRR